MFLPELFEDGLGVCFVSYVKFLDKIIFFFVHGGFRHVET